VKPPIQRFDHKSENNEEFVNNPKIDGIFLYQFEFVVTSCSLVTGLPTNAILLFFISSMPPVKSCTIPFKSRNNEFIVKSRRNASKNVLIIEDYFVLLT
jgi:hypothetical protein